MEARNPRPDESCGLQPPRFGPAASHQRRRAIAMLLTGRDRPDDPSVADFLRQAKREGISLDRLWLAQAGDRPIAAALLVPCAGRTGAAFLGPIGNDAAQAPAAGMLAAMVQTEDPGQLRIVQALLDPDRQQREAATFEAAGFQRLAHLLYMERSTPAEPAPLELPPGMEVIAWSESRRPRFEQAILASYEDTLDCPGLLGLRHIGDIVEGHMSTGRFLPELWLCLLREGEPVGVMLLNLLPQRQAMELVYLGLAPAVRRMGLSRRLLAHGLGLCRRHRATSMVLAVDEANTPAVRLYQGLQFRGTARKLAMVRPVPQR